MPPTRSGAMGRKAYLKETWALTQHHTHDTKGLLNKNGPIRLWITQGLDEASRDTEGYLRWFRRPQASSLYDVSTRCNAFEKKLPPLTPARPLLFGRNKVFPLPVRPTDTFLGPLILLDVEDLGGDVVGVVC